MEDREILEERVTTLKRHIKNYEESNCKTNIYQQLVKECKAIENILEENENFKQASIINDRIFEAERNKNKELEEENSNLKKVKTDEFIVNNPWLFKCLSEVYIPKSLIKEKIEALNDYDSEFCQRVINHTEYTLTEFVQNILQELLRRGEVR